MKFINMSALRIPMSCRQLIATLIVNIFSVHFGVIFAWLLLFSPLKITQITKGYEELNNGVAMFAELPDEAVFLRRLSFLSILIVLPITAYVAERCGRRTALASSTLPFILFSVIIAAAKNATWILVAMIFGAAACGMLLYLVPMYVSEIASKNRKGVYGVIRVLFVGIGLSLGISKANIWLEPMYAMFSLILPMIFLIGLTILPESPLWLARQEKNSEATRALEWFGIDNKLCTQPEVEKLDEALRNSHEIDTRPIKLTRIFQSVESRKGFGISTGLFIGQAILQINWLLCYCLITEFMHDWLGKLNLAILITITSYVLVCVLLVVMIEKIGRRPLLIASCICVAAVLAALGIFYIIFVAVDSASLVVTAVSCVPLAGLAMSFYTLGIGSLPSIIAVEIIPYNVISYVYAISTGFFWIATWIVAESWLSMALTIPFPFWVFGYAATCIVLLVFVCMFVPETKANVVLFNGRVWSS